MSSAPTSRLFRTSLFIAVTVAGILMASRAFAITGSMPLSGFAWSSNVGWISFSGVALNLTPYGVFEDKATGALSGYAWSSNIGWISFNVPDATHPAPVINVTNGKASGWARACAAFADKNLCSGALDPNTGGWDGWISLAGTAADGTAYGMVQSTSCLWTGFAWGSDAIGAVSASGVAADATPYGITGNDPVACAGTCTNLANNPPTCTQCPDGNFFNGTSCAACSGTGCSGIGGTPGNPNGSLACVGGANNPPSCSLFTPTATLTATTTTLDLNQSAILTWSSTNATVCTGTGFTASGTSGTFTTPVFKTVGTQNFLLSCTGPGGTSPTVSWSIEVLAPGATITANPSRVVRGSTSQITWSANGVQSCAVTGPSGTIVPSTASAANHSFTAGSPISPVINAQSTYTITCQTNGTPVTKSATVNITGAFNNL